VLGHYITADMLLKRLTSHELNLMEALNHHQGLLGILLGYGTHNSLLFYNKKLLFHEIESKKLQEKLTNEAIQALSTFGEKANMLVELCKYLLVREN